MGVFVHEVVEVSDSPISWGLVSCREHIEQFGPLEVSLETNDVLRMLFVVITEENLGVVLILHVELHW